jgi:ankyrin repeat protein
MLILFSGCKLNEKSDHGETALYFAAKQGYELIIHLLVEAGADMDICDNSGSSPFHRKYAWKGHIEGMA